jgi:hypothetical protein
MGTPFTLLMAPVVSEPRTPVLGPPKSIRISQPFLQSMPATLAAAQNPFVPYDFSKPYFRLIAIDATQPTNINIYTNPVPFGPYDYSEGPTRISNASAKQFDQQPNYPNFYSNPVPFGPYDYNKVKQPPPAKEPPNWSLNINLYKNPVPFGPYDYNKVWPPQPSRPFDQQPNYPNFYPNPVPFGPFDWSKPQKPPVAKEQPVWSVNINLFTNPVPFGPFDWSKPFVQRPLQVVPALPNIALTTVSVAPPFFNPDFSKPFFVQVRVDQTRSTNINLFTNPFPFTPVDYNISHDVVSSPPQAQPYNILIYTNPVPFGPYDYNKVQKPAPAREPPAWSVNINLMTNPVPFGPFDWNKQWPPLPSRPFEPQPNYPDFYPNPVPFGPFDWSRPSAVRAIPQLPAPAYNILIYSAPFAPIDFSISRPLRSTPDQVYPNLALTAIAPTAAPFVPFDWAKPYFPRTQADQTQQTNINIFTNPVPFGPYDYNRVQPLARAKDQPNWSTNINLLTNPVPFGPYDYNRAVTVPAATPAHPQPYNAQLYTNPVPFAMYDWSRPVTLASVPSAPLPVSIALTTIAAPVPFAQTDWSARPYFPRVAFDASRSLDLELYANPIPFAQHDWSARPGMFPPRAPDQIYPNLPLRPTVVTVTIIQRTLTGIGL